MNLFGVDVSGLDVDLFLRTARHLFPVLALLWLALLLKVRRGGWLLLGVVLANAYVWLETSWALQRLYALGPSNDRLNNVAMVQAVAAGGSPLYTSQVGHMQFEPLWSVLTAALSGWDTDRLLTLYAWLPLLVAAATVLSLYAALRPGSNGDAAAWSPWERAVIAGVATLLTSVPLDFTGPYRVPWAMTFLLKPNHAIGLALAPWVLRWVANASGWRDRVVAALLLHLLGWAFVIHMGAVCVGMVVFAALSLASRSPSACRDARDVAAVIGLNLAVVSPYLWMLFTGYGVFQSGPRLEIPPSSPHLLEITTRTIALPVLAAWGAVVAYQRDRLGRLWTGLLLGAVALWLSYYPLHLLSQAKERDDVYFWFRFVAGVCAGIGLWDLGARLAHGLRTAGSRTGAWLARPEARTAALALVVLPFSLPYWYDPLRMDLYFPGSLPPLADTVRGPVEALRARNDVGVLAGDRAAARWAAALAGFRVTLAKDFHSPRDYGARVQMERSLVRGEDLAAAREAARGYGVTHLLVTPALLDEYAGALADLEARPDLKLVHFSGQRRADYVAVFALTPQPR